MYKLFFVALISSFLFSACMKGQKVDFIVHNAVIHSMDENLTTYEAMAIKDGKIVELGPERQILNKYRADEFVDAMGREIYPGLTDAHVHLNLAAKQRVGVDLSATKSFQQLLMDVEIYAQSHPNQIVIGHGWNEGQWRDNSLPTNEKLNMLFSSTPVVLFRNDGHTALVNQAMLSKVNLNENSKIEGGEVQVQNGVPTGIITDAAMDIVKGVLPKTSDKELKELLIEIQNDLLMYGITNVHDAGLEAHEVNVFKELIDEGRFKLNLYGMLLPTDENITFAKKQGVFQYKNLSIRSFKVFADGALGSHGALLKAPYADGHGIGHATVSDEKLQQLVKLCQDLNYQLNVHAIGDGAVKMVLDAFEGVRDVHPDHRWRMEHAQIIDNEDLNRFAKLGVFPSVQPSHAVSDYLFAEKRLGPDRVKLAYAYKRLLNATGIIAIGTDYPVESMNPSKTIYAACARKNEREEPQNGFFSDQAITLDDCLRGMTVWAALASFSEERLGKLEKGMDATFAIFERKMNVGSTFQQNYAIHTYINGNLVYSAE